MMPKYSVTLPPNEMTQIPSRKEMQDKITACENVDARVIAALLYITGGRVSEVRKLDWTTLHRMKKKLRDDEGHVVGFHRFYQLLLPTLKNPKIKERKVILSVKWDEWAINIINDYFNAEGTLPLYSRSFVWRLMRKYFNWSPHTFRHIRTTILVRNFNLKPGEVMIQNGWSSTGPLTGYMHLLTSDFAHKF